MRLSDYIVIALKDILRQPVRSLLTLFSIALSSAILVSLVAISIGAKNAITQELGLDTSLRTIVVSPNTDISSSILGGNIQLINEDSETLSRETVEKLQAIRNVSSATPTVSVWELKNFKVEGSDKHFVAKATAVESSIDEVMRPVSGGLFNKSNEGREVVLGQLYADELGYSDRYDELIGRTVTFTTQNGYRGLGSDIPRQDAGREAQEIFANTPTQLEAKIVGVSDEGLYKNQLLLPMEWAHGIKTVRHWDGTSVTSEDLIDKNGYSSVIVEADSQENVEGIVNEISEDQYGVYSTQQQIDRLNTYILIMWLVLGSVAAISLLSAGLGIANTMFMTVTEESYVIGVWRACGARMAVIMKFFITQAAILGLVGGLVGATTGYCIGLALDSLIESALTSEGLDGADIAGTSIELLAASVVATVLLSMAAAAYPSYRASRQDPSKALTAS